MPNTLRVKRGLAATLPNGASGEPLFTTDTYELYIGKGDGTNQRYQKYIASGTTSQYLRGDGSLETHNLDSLTDVVVSSPSNGQFLKYNGTNWVNSAGGFLSGGATAAGQVGVFDATTNIVGYTTFTYDTVTDKLSMTNGYVNNTLTVDGQLVIKSESGASAYTRGLKFPDNSYGGAGDIAGLRLHNAGGENIILELYAGNDSLDTINFAVAAGGSTYNDNVTINGNKIWNVGNLPSPLSSTGSITSGEIAIFSNSTTVYSDTALFWDNSLNRLGIGGNSPNAQVGVSTSSGVNAFGYKTSGASYYEMVLVYDNTTYGHLFQTGRGASTSARNITFLNASSTVSIDESGNMGIGLIVPNPGTSGPGGLGLDIYASTTAALALHNATSGTGISAGGRIYYNSTNMTIRNLSTGNMTMTVDNGNFTVITLGAENIKVEGSTGKVGIGAPASIAEMLTVNGSIQQSAVTSSMLKANASGKIIAAVSNTDFQAPITLTTTGTSGAATFNGTTLNIPQYQGVLTNPVTGTGTNNEIAYFNATGSTIASLSTATYPSLTELSYVKGVTSAIQTQLNGKQNTLTNPVTGTGTSGYHAKFTATGSTIGNSLIYDNGVRAISVGNSSTNPWASPFYVIEGGSYGQFLGYQTNAAAIKLGVNAYFNGSNYIYTNSNLGIAILDLTGDATNASLNYYTAPAGTAGSAATLSPRFIIDSSGNGYFVESLGIGFTSGAPNGRIDFRNPANAIIVGKNTIGGTNTYSSIRLTTANSGGVGDSIGEIRGLSTNVNNRDTALTFLTSEGSAGQTEKLRIAANGAATFSSSVTAGGNITINANGSQANNTLFTLSNGYMYLDGNTNGLILENNSTSSTRIRLEAADTMRFETASTERMRITSGGNVGIGTASPASGWKLTTKGTYGIVAQANSNEGGAYMWHDGTDANIMASYETTGGYGAIKFLTSNSERMRITSGGLVTVNDTYTSANYKFAVKGASFLTGSNNKGVFITDTATYVSIVGLNKEISAYNPIEIRASGTDYQLYLSTNGNVGIGTTNPNANLSIYSATTAFINFRNSTNIGTTYGFVIEATGNESELWNYANGYMRFGTNNTERMRITSGGRFKATTDATYDSINGTAHEFNQSVQDWTLVLRNGNVTSPYGLYVKYTGAAPNGTGNEFLYCESATALRAYIRSNGGFSNYQANDTNLSDIRTKADINPLESYWDKFKSLEIVKFKYKDQTHDDYNIGVIAQQVESVAPEFVDVDGWGKTPEDGVPYKSVYTADLHHATIKVLQEAMAKIEVLELELAILKNK